MFNHKIKESEMTWWEYLVKWYLNFEWFRRIVVYVDGPVPLYGSETAGCFDLICEPVTIEPGKITPVELLHRFHYPDSCVLEIVPRSGFAKRGLTIINSPAQIDSDYTGKIYALFYNLGPEPIAITKNACQGWIEYRRRVHFIPKVLVRETARGESGLGSTGT